MHVKPEFVLRQIAGDSILIPTGEAARQFSGLIALNETGKYLYSLLQQECTQESLIQSLVDAFEVDAVTAQEDVAAFLAQLRQVNLLDES